MIFNIILMKIKNMSKYKYHVKNNNKIQLIKINIQKKNITKKFFY